MSRRSAHSGPVAYSRRGLDQLAHIAQHVVARRLVQHHTGGQRDHGLAAAVWHVRRGGLPMSSLGHRKRIGQTRPQSGSATAGSHPPPPSAEEWIATMIGARTVGPSAGHLLVRNI